MKYKVAVILSVYKNDSQVFFKKAIESLKKQTYKNLNVIIVFDGIVSEEINLYVKTLDPTIFIILKNDINLGLPTSLNKAIKYSENLGFDFFARMDADDMSHPERLAKQVNFLLKNKEIDVVGTEAFMIDTEDSIIGVKNVRRELTYQKLRKASNIIHASVMFRSTFFKKVGYYDEQFHQSQDYDLWFRALNNDMKLYSLKEYLYYFRLDKFLVKRRKRAQHYVIKIKKKHLRFWEYIFLLPQFLIIISPGFLLKFILNRKINNKKNY